MSEEQGLQRQAAWPCTGPVELEIGIDVGRVRVELNGGATEVRVQVRHDPDSESPWEQGITGILNWLGEAGGRGGDPAAAAVAAAQVEWDEATSRLVVRSPQELPLRVVPLEVTVWAPAGSRLALRTGAGDVSVGGSAVWAAIRTGSGMAIVDEVTGACEIATGSGRLELGVIGGDARLRTGSGGMKVASLGGSTHIKSGSGDVSLGEVHGDLTVKIGSGDIAVIDAHRGTFDLTTGSGGLRVGVHAGVAAELDLTSGSGSARSDLDVDGVAPTTAPPLRIGGRTGSGDILVTRATPTPV